MCVETTATALLALLAVEDTELTVCLAQWLVQIKSASGGFYSSQVMMKCGDKIVIYFTPSYFH